MDRISSTTPYQSVLMNIMSQETAQNTASQQVTTGKIANDLAGFGAQAETLTATQSLQARVTTYLANGVTLANQLSAQNDALSSVATATQGSATAVSEALATGNATTLMTTLQSQFSSASNALNTQYNGSYLFSGGLTSTRPVKANALSDLTAGVAQAFQNGSTPAVSRLDDDTSVTSGVLASAVGTPLFTALQSIENYNNGPNGPFTGTLTTAQTTFLQGVLQNLNTAYSGVNTVVAQDGVVQDQVKASQTALTSQQTALTNTISDLADADAAKATTNLQLAQTALQASAQVFSTLKSSTLLDFLTTSGS